MRWLSALLFCTIVGVCKTEDDAMKMLACPNERNESILGYRLWDKQRCLTLIEINPAEFNNYEDILYQSNAICKRKLKNGFLRSYLNAQSYEKKLETLKQLNVWSGVQIVLRTDQYAYDRGPFRNNFYKHKYKFAYNLDSSTTRYMWLTRGQAKSGDWEIWEEDGIKHTSPEIWEWRERKWDDQFNTGTKHTPKCLMYHFISNSLVPAAAIDCDQIMKYKTPLVMPCQHDAYKSCIRIPVKECTKQNVNGKLDWYSNTFYMKQYAEAPWGIPCGPFDYGQKCTPKCTGPPGEWTTPPQTNCAYGGKFLRTRKIAISYSKPTCEKEEDQCCVESEEIEMPNCYHYTSDLKTFIGNNTCMNGGRIGTDEKGHRRCECPSQYSGVICETDRCENKCLNGGTCIATADKITCNCQPGYTGEKCAEPTMVCGESNVCLHGGTCVTQEVNKVKVSYCKCTPQFGGENCQNTAETCTPTTCLGHGICIQNDQLRTVTCQCNSGYTGPRCAETTGVTAFLTDTFKSPIGTVTLILIIVLVFVGLIFFAGGTHVVRKRRHRRVRVTHSSATDSTMSSRQQSILSRFSRMGKVSTNGATKKGKELGMTSKIESTRSNVAGRK